MCQFYLDMVSTRFFILESCVYICRSLICGVGWCGCFAGLFRIFRLYVFWALCNYVTRRCKGNLMVHIMMDYRDEKGVHIPHLGQRCLYNIQAVVFWLEGVIRHESISCVCKYFMLLQRRNGFMRSGVRRR